MITVLSGINSHAVSQKFTELKTAFIKKHGEDGVEIFDSSQLQPEQLSSLLTGVTLFATNRFVVIKNLSASKALAEQFLATVNSVPEEVEVVLLENQMDKRTVLYKTLKKEAEFYEFGELDEAGLTNWILTEVKQQNGEIDSVTARFLTQYMGLDQARMQQEINKLLAFNPKITKETIKELVEPSPQDTIFQLLELALSGRNSQALEVLSGLERAHEDPFQTASMLIWQTHILALVHSAKGASDSEIAKNAKINPFVVRKTRSLANNMNKTKLNQIIDAVAECDVRLKSTSAEPWRVVEQAILTL